MRRKLKSRIKRQSYLFKSSGMVLQDYVQAEGQLIPKFVELCVKYIETEGKCYFVTVVHLVFDTGFLILSIFYFTGLLVEGIYRVPGNTAQVELLKEMFAHDSSINISSLEINVNAVATALKKFFSDLAEPLIPIHLNEELVIADSKYELLIF